MLNYPLSILVGWLCGMVAFVMLESMLLSFLIAFITAMFSAFGTECAKTLLEKIKNKKL